MTGGSSAHALRDQLGGSVAGGQQANQVVGVQYSGLITVSVGGTSD
jgi:hypothetical protein